MTKQENAFMQQLKELGLVDDRQLYVASEIMDTRGNSGRAWAFLNGTVLSLYALEFPAGLGEHVATLELKGARVAKASAFLFAPSLTLECGGGVYKMRNFNMPKQWIAAVREACGV